MIKSAITVLPIKLIERPPMAVINIRINFEEKKRLAEAAALEGVSLSAFLRAAAIKRAHQVLGPPRLVPKKSFFDGLTDEQKAQALAYDGPENHGEPWAARDPTR